MKLKELVDIGLKLEHSNSEALPVYYLDEYGNLLDVDRVVVKDVPFLGCVLCLMQEEVDL